MSDAGITEVDATVLAAVRELVSEVRSPDAATSVELDRVLDRELGLGSLELVELVHRVQELLGIDFSPDVLGAMATPRDLAEATRRATRLVRRQRPALRPPLPLTPVDTWPDHARSLGEVFDWHVGCHPERLHIRILDDSDAHDLSYASLQREAAVSAVESIRRFRILPGGFSEEADELTPTLKLKRAVIAAHFRTEIDALHGDHRPDLDRVLRHER